MEDKPITYQECADSVLFLWMEDIISDREYNRIMDKLNKAHEEGTVA